MIAIIGGGIIGLLTGIACARRKSTSDIVIFEREQYLGDHTSGRNSGVLHSGIYYPTKSLKHRLCLEGLVQWKQLAHDLKIPHQFCGKYIFAADSNSIHGKNQLDELEKLKIQATQNGVPFLPVHQNKLSELKNFVDVAEAIFIPSTGLLDVSQALYNLETHLIELGGLVMRQHQITTIERLPDGTYQLEFAHGEPIVAEQVINCAGLEALNLSRTLWDNQLENYFVKGNYLKYTGDFFKKSFLYPCPEPELKGLGIHSTFDIQGQVRFGPNTQEIPNFKVNPEAKPDYSIAHEQCESMRSAILKLYPNIDAKKLSPDYSGIRPKIKWRNSGQLHADFWIKGPRDHGLEGYVELCGIESPGLTAAPAIGEMAISLLS